MKKINKKKLFTFITLILLVVVILSLLLIRASLNGEQKNEELASLSKEVVKEKNIDKVRNMTERDRIDYYFSNFLSYIESNNYEAAYGLLYEDFKNNYFPTLEEFERYFKNNFPVSSIVNFDNIERLDDIYVLWVDISDLINGEYGKNFSMKVVIQEYGYDDYKLSFSVDSALNKNTEE